MRRRLGLSLLATLLCCALAVPAFGVARPGGHAVYRGKTSQKRSIQISASPSRITLIRFKVKLLCRDGSLLFGDASDFEPTPLNPGGHFANAQYGKTDVISWKGRIGKGRITGVLRVKDRLANGVRCDSQSVRFVANQMGR